VALLSARLRRLSFNFCLSSEQFAELLALRGNELFRGMLREWFAAFQNTRSSTIVNGLEFLAALAIACADGKTADKARTVFDLFDFDESGAITLDELNILLKSAVRGLSKMTKGLGPRLASLCPMAEIAEIASQCFEETDLEEEQDLPRELFVSWVRRTPKIASLLRCFAQKEFVGEEQAAITLQRCVRGMHARRRAAEIRYERQLEMEQEMELAVRFPLAGIMCDSKLNPH
jgi:Ca2+-binding EF-hand superfamily protein